MVPFDPVHAPVSDNVMAVTGGAAFVHAGHEREGVIGGETPPRAVGVIEVQHHAVTCAAGTVEDQPLRVCRFSDDDRVSPGDCFRRIADRSDAQVGFPSSPIEESFQDAQFNPRNMSRSVPTFCTTGSQ